MKLLLIKVRIWILKFIYSEKATKFWEISNLDLTVCSKVKPKVDISSNYVAFSEYMNFNGISSTNSSTATKTLQPLKWVQATGVAQGDFYQSGFVQMKKTESWHQQKKSSWIVQKIFSHNSYFVLTLYNSWRAWR